MPWLSTYAWPLQICCTRLAGVLALRSTLAGKQSKAYEAGCMPIVLYMCRVRALSPCTAS